MRRTSVDKLVEFEPAGAGVGLGAGVGVGVGGQLIFGETGPFCSIGCKPQLPSTLLPRRCKMGNTFGMAMTTTSSGLQYEDTREGQGASPTKGQTCVMHYTGWLWVDGKKGEKFDSSVDRGRPFTFPIGAGRVIKGWDEGVATMKIGGTRSLLIPAELGYGASGAGGVIPPNATLLFEVELLGVQ